MNVRLIFASEAKNDLATIYDWYEDHRSGLGEEFLGCIDACVHSICRSPQLYEIVRGDYRRALVRRFPYSLFFKHENNAIAVYAIVHNSRNPVHVETAIAVRQ